MKIDRLNNIVKKGFQTSPYIAIREGDGVNLLEIQNLLTNSKEGKVNIRSYKNDKLEGNPFIYGLSNMYEIEEELLFLRMEGYSLILNEMINVDDGGVSGVMLNGLVDFAPFATPRAVEKKGICTLPIKIALSIWEKVYNLNNSTVDKLNILSNKPNTRVEFSIHPNDTQYTIWDMEEVNCTDNPIQLKLKLDSDFSKMLGNKTFGLLLMDSIGIMLPQTEIHNRFIPNFKFGTLKSDIKWTRTSPRTKQPGMFLTERGEENPIKLISGEVPSVLIQSEVKPIWAGSSLYEDGKMVIEGVKGFGDRFMIGIQPSEEVPQEIQECVKGLNQYIQNEFKVQGILDNAYKLEWGWTADDGIVLYQFNIINELNLNQIIVKGSVSGMEYYNTEEGLEGLRELIPTLDKGIGIILKGNVGITSHFCDILRQEGIPSKLVTDI